MTVNQIIQALSHLSQEDRELIHEHLDQLQAVDFEETPETLQALEEARQAVLEGKVYSIEEVQRLVTQWTLKSP